MRSCILALAASLLATPALSATCAPAKLVKVVTRAVGPDIAAGSFRAAPVTLYRQGERFLRTEEAADPARKVHVLIVAAEPDIWFVNLFDKTGRHIVDPGPTYEVKAPIVAGAGVPAKFVELEFGCEAVFAKGRGYEGGTRDVGGRPAKIYAMVEGAHRLEVLLSSRDEPVEVAYFQGARTMLTIRYDSFQGGLPDNPALFAKPDGIAYQQVAGQPKP